MCNIAVKYPTIPGISQPVASAFQLLAANSSSHIRISVVQEGSVAAIAALLRNSTDVLTYQHCLLALCNLLYEPDNHLSIVQQGLIVTLINLSTHENEVLKDLCALAFLNLSCAEESRKNAVNGGAVVAIIRLATQPSKVTKVFTNNVSCLCYDRPITSHSLSLITTLSLHPSLLVVGEMCGLVM